jgi:hypothetical protein
MRPAGAGRLLAGRSNLRTLNDLSSISMLPSPSKTTALDTGYSSSGDETARAVATHRNAAERTVGARGFQKVGSMSLSPHGAQA